MYILIFNLLSNNMHKLLLKIITLLHVIFVVFTICVPITNSNYFLSLHSCLMPFLLLHWVTNDNTCVLTTVEKFARKKYSKEYDEMDCFTCRLIDPVYNFKENNVSHTKLIYMVTIFFWLLSSSKLLYKYRTGEISKWQQFFII